MSALGREREQEHGRPAQVSVQLGRRRKHERRVGLIPTVATVIEAWALVVVRLGHDRVNRRSAGELRGSVARQQQGRCRRTQHQRASVLPPALIASKLSELEHFQLYLLMIAEALWLPKKYNMPVAAEIHPRWVLRALARGIFLRQAGWWRIPCVYRPRSLAELKSAIPTLTTVPGRVGLVSSLASSSALPFDLLSGSAEFGSFSIQVP